MHKSFWNYYGVKLIYHFTVTGQPIAERIDENYSDTHTFFEESVMLVKARSPEHAYKIAEHKANDYVDTYTNLYGQTVKLKLVDAIDCFSIIDDLISGTELYSSILPVKREITPSEYLMQKYEYNVDDYDKNHQRNEKNIQLQTVLGYEEFSKWRSQET